MRTPKKVKPKPANHSWSTDPHCEPERAEAEPVEMASKFSASELSDIRTQFDQVGRGRHSLVL